MYRYKLRLNLRLEEIVMNVYDAIEIAEEKCKKAESEYLDAKKKFIDIVSKMDGNHAYQLEIVHCKDAYEEMDKKLKAMDAAYDAKRMLSNVLIQESWK